MIVIVGATGHLGNNLARELVKNKEDVRAIILPSEDTAPIKNLNIEQVTGDVRDINSLVKAFTGADIVYHMAGVVTISKGKKS